MSKKARASRRPTLALRPERHVCAYCDQPATTWDHVDPIAQGGDNGTANLVPACERCNARKAALPLVVFLARERAALGWEVAPDPDRLRSCRRRWPGECRTAPKPARGTHACTRPDEPGSGRNRHGSLCLCRCGAVLRHPKHAGTTRAIPKVPRTTGTPGIGM